MENIVLFTGYYSGEVIFNVDTLKSSSTTDNNTGFFVYDVNGNPINGKDVLGLGEDRSELIAIDDRGDTYISGQFQSDTLFIGSDLLINTIIGSKCIVYPALASEKIPKQVESGEVVR